MSATPRRRRRSGSLGALKSAFWAVIEYNLSVVEDPALDHELRQKAGNALTQAGQAYAKVLGLYDLEAKVKALESLAAGNGHHP